MLGARPRLRRISITDPHQPRAAGRRRVRRLYLGALDRLLHKLQLEFDGIIATSSGAMNALGPDSTETWLAQRAGALGQRATVRL